MRGWWCALAAALLVARAHAWPALGQDALPASNPTHDALLVTRADDATSPPPPLPTAAAHPAPPSTSEVGPGATDAPPAPLKMVSMEVVSEVALRYAHTTVLTRMRNPGHRAQEATFSLILPETAFISGFVMTLNGTPYKAYVKEKEEAKAEYASAVAQGLGAAHVSAKARDSNHFTVRVNIEPQSEGLFNLTYEELLERRGGVYNHAINLNPGRAVPRLDVTVHIKEGRRISVLRVPDVRTGNEIDATELDAQNALANIVKSSDEKEATIKFSPDIAEQQRLMDIYTQKTRESRSRSGHSYRYPYEPEEQDQEAVGVLGQFVVQYDVEHGNDGEIFLNDGYFVHFFSPPQLPPLSKHVVFVLDTSGSMMDRKIVQLREAMTSILSELNAGDYFNIVEFASNTHVYRLDEANQERKPQHYSFYSYGERSTPIELVAPSPVTEENIRLAKIIVSRLYASGGTNINEALSTAIQLVNCGVGCNVKSPKTLEPFALHDGQPTSSSPAPSTPTPAALTSSSAAPSTTARAVAEPSTDGVAGPEPIIIFLTDGDPTVGEMDPKRIIKRISELNTGRKRAAIFSLAFGEDADRKFLRKLSLRNDGFLRHIYEAADAAQQLSHFYRQVSSPLLANVRFVYPPAQVDEGSVTKRRFHTLYKGAEVVVAGRVADLTELQPFSPQVEGFCGVHGDEKKLFASEVRVAPPGDGAFGPLERLWAYLTIKQKLDERDAAADSGDVAREPANDTAADPEREALRLALKYSFVTPLTSLVVVKPNATSAVDAESLDNKQSYPTAALNGYAFSSAAGQSLIVGGGGGGSLINRVAGAPGFAGPPGAAGYAAYPQSAPGGNKIRVPYTGHRRVALILSPPPATFAAAARPQAQFDYPAPLAASALDSFVQESDDIDLDEDKAVPESARLPAYYPSALAGYSHFAPRDSFTASHYSVPQFLQPPVYGLRGGSIPYPRHPYPPRHQLTGDVSAASGTNVVDASGTHAPFLTTWITSTRPPLPAPTVSVDPLQAFGLQEFGWARPLVDAAAARLTLQLNGSAVPLRLAPGAPTDLFPGAGASCARAAGAEGEAATPGVCTYLPHCAAARAITAQLYAEIHCDRDGYAGVCCPERAVPTSTPAAPVPEASVAPAATPVPEASVAPAATPVSAATPQLSAAPVPIVPVVAPTSGPAAPHPSS